MTLASDGSAIWGRRRLVKTPSRATALVVALVAAVLLAFQPAFGAGWLEIWDDDNNFLSNPDFRPFSIEAIGWAFTTTRGGPYQPLSWLTLSLDRTLGGLDPTGYHVTNVLLHAAGTVAAFALFAELLTRVRWGAQASRGERHLAAALGALVFAVHPLRVESVVWITERRDVLAGLFYLLCLRAYLVWHRPERSARAQLAAAATCLALFVLSLLAKASAMTLPFALLAIDAWPLGRFRDDAGRLRIPLAVLLEKLPFVAVAAAAGAVAWAGQQGPGASVDRGLLAPCSQAAYGLTYYAGSTVLPIRLTPLHQLLAFDPTGPRALGAALVVTAIVATLWFGRRRVPALASAAFFYACIAAPTIGLTQFGSQLVADRYSYFACVPLAALAAGAAVRSRGVRAALVVVVLALGIQTHVQARVWRDSVSLWTHAVSVDPRNAQAHCLLATAHLERDQLARAEIHLRVAIELVPHEPFAWCYLGLIHAKHGDLGAAFRCWEETLRLRPGHEMARMYIDDARRGVFPGGRR